MAQVIWSNTALDDLELILDYIALENNSAAKDLAKAVFAKTDALIEHPCCGKTIEELADLDYRQILVNPMRIIYRLCGDKVQIYHVVRQERELKLYLIQMASSD